MDDHHASVFILSLCGTRSDPDRNHNNSFWEKQPQNQGNVEKMGANNNNCSETCDGWLFRAYASYSSTSSSSVWPFIIHRPAATVRSVDRPFNSFIITISGDQRHPPIRAFEPNYPLPVRSETQRLNHPEVVQCLRLVRDTENYLCLFNMNSLESFPLLTSPHNVLHSSNSCSNMHLIRCTPSTRLGTPCQIPRTPSSTSISRARLRVSRTYSTING